MDIPYTRNKFEYVTEGKYTKLLITTRDDKRYTLLLDTPTAEILEKEKYIITVKVHRNGIVQILCHKSIPKKVIKQENLGRWILGINDTDARITFKNQDMFDFREENLIEADKTTIIQNRRGAQSNSTSGIRGVNWYKRKSQWAAECRVNKKKYFAGYHNDQSEAEKAVIKKRQEVMEHSYQDQIT